MDFDKMGSKDIEILFTPCTGAVGPESKKVKKNYPGM
jgi:hypothetical protein